MTSTYTVEHLRAIEMAIATGEKVIRRGDKTIEFRSVDELIRAKAAILDSLNKQAGVSDNSTTYASFSRD